MRHLEAAELWIQQIVRSGRAEHCKVNGQDNFADLFTKFLTRDEIIRHMANLGFRMFSEDGRELGVKAFTDTTVSEQDEDTELQDPKGEKMTNVLERHTAWHCKR